MSFISFIVSLPEFIGIYHVFVLIGYYVYIVFSCEVHVCDDENLVKDF